MAGVEVGGGQLAQNPDRGDRDSGPYHGNIHIGDIFEQRDFLAAPVEDAAGDRTRPQFEDSGRLQQSLLLLHHSVRARAEPQRARRTRDRAGPRPGPAISGDRTERASIWGDGAGNRAAVCGWPICCAGCSRRRMWSGCASVPFEPMDFSDDLLHLMADSPRIATHVHAAAAKRVRPDAAAHAPQVSSAALCGPRGEGAGADAGRRDRRRRHGGFSGRDRRRIRREPAIYGAMPFTYLHVFTYSERPGTPAAGEAVQVPMPVRKARNRVLRELAAARNLAFRPTHGGPDAVGGDPGGDRDRADGELSEGGTRRRPRTERPDRRAHRAGSRKPACGRNALPILQGWGKL